MDADEFILWCSKDLYILMYQETFPWEGKWSHSLKLPEIESEIILIPGDSRTSVPWRNFYMPMLLRVLTHDIWMDLYLSTIEYIMEIHKCGSWPNTITFVLPVLRNEGNHCNNSVGKVPSRALPNSGRQWINCNTHSLLRRNYYKNKCLVSFP